MNHDTDNPLRALEREALPPPLLKGRVTHSLRDRGRLRGSGGLIWRHIWPTMGAIAAAVILFTAGVATGRRPVARVADTRPSYALLLYEGSDFRRDRPEAETIAEYRAWAAGLRARGALVRGEALDTTAHLLRETPQGVLVESGDAVSDQGVMAGFFIIRATDEAEAMAIARTCPHLSHGGRIALRPVIPTS